MNRITFIVVAVGALALLSGQCLARRGWREPSMDADRDYGDQDADIEYGDQDAYENDVMESDYDDEMHSGLRQKGGSCTRSGLCRHMNCAHCCKLSPKGVPSCLRDRYGRCGFDLRVEEIPGQNICASDNQEYHWPNNMAYASCQKNELLKEVRKGSCKKKGSGWWPWG